VNIRARSTRTAAPGGELNEAAHQAGFPDFDAESLAAGHLAGPASKDRPPVPVWEYLDYVAQHPEVSIDEISQVRFPISFHGGGSMITSIAEHMAPGPVPPTFSVTTEDIVRLFALMHDAGAMQWNAATRTIEELKPRASNTSDPSRHTTPAKGTGCGTGLSILDRSSCVGRP
jgi:hypothetical protein